MLYKNMYSPLFSFSTTTRPEMGNAPAPVSIWKFNKSIHVMAVDGIINVNSLFTVAVFLGLASYPTVDPKSTLVSAKNTACIAGTSIAENLISRQVYSFSCFLFSSLIASALKQAIKSTAVAGDGGALNATSVHVNVMVLRIGIVVSAIGSVFGCGFLMVALVDLVQIKLGVLSCLNVYSLAAIVPLVILVPSALVIYICIVIYAFIR